MPNPLTHLKQLFFKGDMLPTYIVLYITDACNLACRHCFYYADLNSARTIKMAELEKLADSIPKTVNISFTGGEPFVIPHLPDAVKLFHERSGMEVASIPSNGIYEDRILPAVERMCTENPGLTVNIGMSLDGLEEKHDHVRVIEGGFKTTIKTLGALCEMKKKHKNLNIAVITTINSENEDDALPLYEMITGNYDVNQFLVNFIRGDAKELSPSPSTLRKYQEIHRRIHQELIEGKTQGYGIFLQGLYNAVSMRTKKAVLDTIRDDTFQTQCYAGTTNIIIGPDGVVRACEIRTDVEMGDLKEHDWNLQKLMASAKAKAVKDDILPSGCYCSFECQASCNTAYNPVRMFEAGVDYLRTKTGTMGNHFTGELAGDTEAKTGMRSKADPKPK